MPDVPDKPLVVFDGECSFCRRWVTRWQSTTGDTVAYEPYQSAAPRFPQVPSESFARAVHLFEPDGTHSTLAQAVFRAFALAGRRRTLLWSYQHLPGFSTVTEFFYQLISRHRSTADRIDRLLFGNDPRPPTYLLSRALFLRLIGLVYFIAFASLRVQIDGLVGSHGILPAADLLQRAATILGPDRFLQLPTLLWLNSSDTSLHLLCDTGLTASVLLVIGLLPAPLLAWLWLSYLSLTTVGQDFLSFQWDSLLLEAGLLSIFYAPLLHLRSPRPPSRIVIFLLRWLLFRLMFMSAVVKWTSADPAWHTFTALRYHYETQPLPPWPAWYFHHTPDWFGHCSAAMVFFIEGLIPFLYFAPRRPRLWACGFTLLLQGLILATGNYGFFNLLSIALCVPLLDDATLKRGPLRPPRLFTPRIAWIRATLLAPLAAAIFWLTIEQVLGAAGYADLITAPPILRSYADPLRSANPYGLFAVMTTTRPEIIIEGSTDGTTWKEYPFRYKIGDLTRPPAVCVPHMPLLDWQMWFAALGDLRSNPWFANFLQRLLEGQPQVTALLANNPFPDHPPRYIRATLYDYHFTTQAERAATNAWWTRRELGTYCPTVTLDANGHLQLVTQ